MAGRLVFSHDDLLRCRFAVSPLWEATAAVRLLGEPHRGTLRRLWPAAIRERNGTDLGLDPLPLLSPRPGYTPDFLTPPPPGPSADLEDELEALLTTPPEQVAVELRQCLLDPRRALPESVTGPLLADPEATLERIVRAVRRAWEALVAPHWPRARALLEADVSLRARTVAEGGLREVIAAVAPDARWRGRVLHLPDPAQGERTLDGRGLVLMPSVFMWPETVAKTEEPWQPTLFYPVHGVGRLWEAEPPAPAGDALARLLGGTRARLLTVLAEPSTTTVLARAHGWSPATVSEHLSVLRAAGLVRSWRVGRRVFYTRTPAGDTLLRAGGPVGRTPGADPGEARV
ncbi:DUF5937 family protein [Nocardiopsis changdeensis]|uniref:ArsR/SmtB family transcription factor n=1 Tax=Nocardiopsis TaxID=2013 RepID=UPI002102E2B2|nr:MULTISPECIES: DUF5937 family protein [Nocardiopsis]